MQKSYVAKSPINFVQFSFRVNAGDILVHDTIQQKLTVYRNGGIVKTMKQSSIGMSALIKDKFCEEIVEARPTPQAIADALKFSLPKLKQDLPKTPSKEEIQQKRKKAQATEVPIESLPKQLQEAIKKPRVLNLEDETV